MKLIDKFISVVHLGVKRLKNYKKSFFRPLTAEYAGMSLVKKIILRLIFYVKVVYLFYTFLSKSKVSFISLTLFRSNVLAITHRRSMSI